MKRSVSYNKRLVKHLRNPVEVEAYLSAVLEERDPRLLKKAVAKVVAAKARAR